MICGNDPSAQPTTGDKAVLDWFTEWLEWAWRRDNEGAVEPEPECPNGRAIDVAAQTKTCTRAGEVES